MKIQKIVSIILVSVFALSGCVSLYVPNPVNAPLLSEAGETNIQFQFSTGGNDLQFATAITDNLAIMVNGQYINRDDNESPANTKLYFGEFGIGYLPELPGNGVFEIYAGGGYGHSDSRMQTNYLGLDFDFYAKGDYNRFFLQTNFGRKFKIAELGLATRLVLLNFENVSYQGLNSKPKETAALLEPALFLRLGPPLFKFGIMAGYSFQLSSESLLLQYDPFIISAGISLRF